jgi:hypothetical protein
MDIMLVGTAFDMPPSRQRGNARLALAAVTGIAVVDIIAAVTTSAERRRTDEPRQFTDRSGFPRGVKAAHGAARNFLPPTDMRDPLRAAH